jgi:5-hydroxyisourate hydrolase-like protein (transthyretin family)
VAVEAEPASSRLSLKLSANSVVQGTTVTVRSTLKSSGEPVPGRTLVIERRTKGSKRWTKVASVKTDSKGVDKYALKTSTLKPATYYLRVRFGGDDEFRKTATDGSARLVVKNKAKATATTSTRVRTVRPSGSKTPKSSSGSSRGGDSN